jgi:hypothetical protein
MDRLVLTPNVVTKTTYSNPGQLRDGVRHLVHGLIGYVQ